MTYEETRRSGFKSQCSHPSSKQNRRGMKNMELSIKNFNAYTIAALIVLIGGILFYITWGLRYGVWADVGIYSITIILVLTGLLGTIISLTMEKSEKSDEE